MPNISVELAVDLVRASIGRIHRAIERWRDAEADSRASTQLRFEMKAAIRVVEREFGMQWANVEAILNAMIPPKERP